MKTINTNQLEVGMNAAHIQHRPAFVKPFEIAHQGIIHRIKATDIWGDASETHTTIWIRSAGEEIQVITVHNSHVWMVL